MRLRYAAYVLGRADYLLATWHPPTRPATFGLGAERVRWLDLKVCRVGQGNPEDNEGIVECVARCKIGGRASRLHETSRFVKEGGRWFYMDALPTV